MARVGNEAWFAENQVLQSVRMEPVVVLVVLALLAWAAYKTLLRSVSPERHQLFREEFRSLALHLSIGLSGFLLHQLLRVAETQAMLPDYVLPYLGLVTIAWGCVVLVKTLRIFVFEYLFFTNMKAGVPALIANIISLIMSVVVGGWFLTRFFELDLTPLLATSAIVSIVLGLALQDTLGNLFAAISLQIDKPFELGDWIEVRNGSDRQAGQVQEVTWRATLLLAVTDELITIPNRIMAQSQIMNYGGRRAFYRSHIFRIPYESSLETAKLILHTVASSVPGIAHNPPPVVLVVEASESWISLRVSYCIFDYGSQFSIADRFLSQALLELEGAGIRIAAPRLSLEARVTGPSSAVST